MVQVGIPVVVLEREPAPREEGSAITFWPNAFRVLDTLGVAHHVRETHSLVHRQDSILPLFCHEGRKDTVMYNILSLSPCALGL